MGNFRLALFCLFLAFYACSAFSSQKFLIVAKGSFDYQLVKECSEGRTIIALDGAAAHFYKFELPVDYILGDFDSLEGLVKKGIEVFNIKDALEYFKTIKTPDESTLVFEP